MEKHNEIEAPEGLLSRKKLKLVVDIKAVPKGMPISDFMKCVDSGYVFYDSDEGARPRIYAMGEGEEEVLSMIDANGKEANIDDLKKQWEDDEFWRKELYKCRQSPLHYFTNYVSIDPKPTQEAIDKFLAEKGFVAMDDSDDAVDINEATLKVREAFAAEITLEKLKELKPVRDRIDEEYKDYTRDLCIEFGEKYDISSTHEQAITKKIATLLMKVKPADASLEHRYFLNERTGRWDGALIKATDLDVLLRLWKTL